MEQQQQPEGGEQHPERESQPGQPEPRIYVASLADYNNGVLHGEWLHADVEPDELYQQVQAMLARSEQPNADEWAIHDYEGFARLRIEEYEDLDTVARVAAGIARHGEAFAAYAEWVGTDHATEEDFTDHHAGSFESIEAFARDLAESLGWEHELEQFAEDSGIGKFVVIDYAALAADIRQAWHVTEGEQAVHIFYP